VGICRASRNSESSIPMKKVTWEYEEFRLTVRNANAWDDWMLS
jgi:hypothetical protein